MKRIPSIDIVRGIVMIIMALDHTRDLMHINSIAQSPTDLSTTSPILFFTRWITYLCAPIFVFLAGTSAYLALKKNDNVQQTRSHLIKRGFWLLVLEFTIVNFALYFDPGFHTLLFEVIASTGLGFILLGLLIKLPSKSLGIIGLAIILLHNLTPLIPFAEGSIVKAILTPFFGPTAVPLGAGRIFIMGYPPIPWLGILLVGFASGQYFFLSDERQKRTFTLWGVAAIAFFIVIRMVNVYGDSAPWSAQQSPLFTFLSFMNVTKYPPSLAFCAITLGIMFILLAYADSISTSIKNVLTVYGKVPMFYFIVHFHLIHVITVAVLLIQGLSWSQLEFATGTFGRPKDVESGLPLWAVYFMWMSVVALMYKPCQWYASYKEAHKDTWLKYI